MCFNGSKEKRGDNDVNVNTGYWPPSSICIMGSFIRNRSTIIFCRQSTVIRCDRQRVNPFRSSVNGDVILKLDDMGI